ncbi:cyclic AMP-responsive element-binding protein-like isoform X2 [Bolinopsis microptera]|uniref:cyclic AMP-responsive element-binding protein-like isoform X2 n=1 Tax=Bolinopsis microptera TaxID=2820187 RepID=UPI0030795C58
MDNNSSSNLLQNSFESQLHVMLHPATSRQRLLFQEDADNEKRAALQREQLSRRPSYRKILDELASESGTGSDNKQDSKLNLAVSLNESHNAQVSQPAVITINNSNLAPPHQQQILAGPQTSNMGGLFHTPVIVTSDVMSVLASTLTNSSNSGGQPTVVALPQGTNSDQSATIMSFNNSQADLQNLSATQVLSNVIQAPRTALITTPYYNIHRPPNNQGIPGGNHQTPQQLADEASKKREIRLMKNREAARHCRVKKKEYLKCLEERVQILEGQNKKLIDELKALKEFYTQHKKDYPEHNI